MTCWEAAWESEWYLQCTPPGDYPFELNRAVFYQLMLAESWFDRRDGVLEGDLRNAGIEKDSSNLWTLTELMSPEVIDTKWALASTQDFVRSLLTDVDMTNEDIADRLGEGEWWRLRALRTKAASLGRREGL
eukprot:TRINITY_DN11169_c0_g1_i9.p2 TRINITY_DN11169_c0_g1~~TRINITY_DN11169_c0_g1_i9.p2  ORF type:complete len:132 (+),score=12.98 TRINITY_DN11169_c0_g1_i9:514-909(+)